MRARNPSIAALCLASLLSACGGSAPVKSAATTAKKPAVAQAAAPQETGPSGPAYVYIYNPVGKRDPFRSPVQTVQAGPEGPCSEPLCKWDLDQLALVAVVTGDANPFAMVEDPHGRGYILRRNTKIGKKGGKVTQILRDSVTVTEFWTAPDGTQKPNYLNLQLKPDRAALPELDLISGKSF